MFKSFIFGVASFLSFALVSPAAIAQRLAPATTEQFYSGSATEQAWSDENYDQLLLAIAALDAHGLNPEHYGLSRLQAAREDRTGRDRLATSAWLLAASHLLYGKTDAVSLEPHWTVVSRQSDIVSALRTALSNGSVSQSLNAFAPVQPIYGAMQEALAVLKIQAETSVAIVAEGELLRKGASGTRVDQLRTRLIQMGWLSQEESSATTFDDALFNAVKAFQEDAELDADGIVGPATIRALNRGPEEQINQLRANMERFRWLPDDLGRRHLRANIASFDVTAFENGSAARTYLTIVGKTYRSTPVFSDEIEYIDFNPWWETPDSLARSDKLPMFQRDPASVTSLGFQILDRTGARVPSEQIDWNSLSRSTFP